MGNCKLSELKNNKPVYVYAIVLWILQYSKDGDGLGFPFDLPYVSLYERCCTARKIVGRLILLLAELKTVYKPLVQLKKILMDTDNQKVKLIHEKMVFKMEQELEAFKNELYKNLLNDKSQVREKKIIFDHLERYKEKLFLTNFRVDPNDPSKDIIMERTNNIEEQQFRKFKRNQRRIHGNRDVGHDLNFYGSYLPIVWNLNHDEYIKTVYGSMKNIPVVFSQVSNEMFKLERKRFYAERRGRMIKFKHDDSELFKIIGQGMDNLESQSNGLLTP